ncbi:MAG: NADH-quinone oxidoreductase subunit H [Desulfohalobiaceae bacterium]|nr:NADH-quinone oxidoreductase subunit H [Desulfohalobiaceae bacterium]
MSYHSLLLGLTALILAPLAGGIAAGLDRKLTARLQSRYGPPVTQPFYDVLKLFGKECQWVNIWAPFFALLYLFANAAALLLFVLGGDLLLLFFIMTLALSCLIIGALAAVSPYSRLGADRELILALMYEPLLLSVFLGIAQAAGSFDIDLIQNAPGSIFLDFPLGFAALFLVFLIKLHKSPFDFTAAHHAHQELVQGILTEYAGPFLAVVEIGHWYEIVLLLLLFTLFRPFGGWGTVLIPIVLYLLVLIVDNTVPRLTWRWTLRRIWIPGWLLVSANLAWMAV